jgi:hypothetical protein
MEGGTRSAGDELASSTTGDRPGGSPKADFAGLYQPQPLHAGMSVLADDDVIVHGDAERTGDVDDRFCHLDVRLRRRRIAGGMIVHQLTMPSIALILLVFRIGLAVTGAVVGSGNKCPFVIVPQRHAASH